MGLIMNYLLVWKKIVFTKSFQILRCNNKTWTLQNIKISIIDEIGSTTIIADLRTGYAFDIIFKNYVKILFVRNKNSIVLVFLKQKKRSKTVGKQNKAFTTYIKIRRRSLHEIHLPFSPGMMLALLILFSTGLATTTSSSSSGCLCPENPRKCYTHRHNIIVCFCRTRHRPKIGVTRL